jgi:hypothetical protein
MAKRRGAYERQLAADERERGDEERAKAALGGRSEDVHARAAVIHDDAAKLHDDVAELLDVDFSPAFAQSACSPPACSGARVPAPSLVDALDALIADYDNEIVRIDVRLGRDPCDSARVLTPKHLLRELL